MLIWRYYTHPSRWLPQSRENKIEQGWPGSPLAPSGGAFELTHGSACIIGWQSGLLDSLISTYIAQSMGYVINRIHYGLKVVFNFRHFTVFHYHHYARLIAGNKHIDVCRLSCGGDWKDISIAHVLYHHQIGSIHLSNCFQFFSWMWAWDVCYIIFYHLLYMHSGKAGNLFSLVLCSLWWVQIVGYVLACRSCSFVFTLHHLIIIFVHTFSEDIELIKCLSDIICRVCE